MPPRARGDGRQRLGGLRRARARTTSPARSTGPTRSACARPTSPGTSGPSRRASTRSTASRPPLRPSPRRRRRRATTRRRPGPSPTDAGTSVECRLSHAAPIIVDWSAVRELAHPRPHGRDRRHLHASASAPPTPPATSSPVAMNVYTLDRAAPVAPTITAGPPARLERRHAHVRRSRPRRAPRRVPHRARRDRRQRLGGLHEPAHLRPLGAARRRVHLPRPRDRRRRATPAPRRPASTPRPQRARPRRTSPATRRTVLVRPDAAATFTDEAGSTVACRIERGATVRLDWAPCSSPHTYNLTAEPDGTYTFRVRATDAAGNTGSETIGMYRLDRVAPTAPTITGAAERDHQRRDADVVVHRRRRHGVVRVPDRRRKRDDGPELGGLHEPEDLRHLRAARRHVHLLGTRHRRRGQLEPVLAGHVRARPHRAGRAVDHRRTERPVAERDAVLLVHGGGRATTACRLERGATVVSDWATVREPAQLRPDAAARRRLHVPRTRDRRRRQHRAPQGTRTYTLDRTAPVAPTITAGPPADSSDDTPVYSFTGEAGATFACRLERGATRDRRLGAVHDAAGYDSLRRSTAPTPSACARPTRPATPARTRPGTTRSTARRPPPRR